MAPSTTEAFVVQMLQATLHRTGIADIRVNDVGSSYHLQAQTQGGNDRRQKGTLILTLPEAGTGDIVVEYDIWGNGKAWTEGTITLYWASLPRHRSEFFCELDQDDISVHRIEVLYKRRILRTSIEALLNDVGKRSAMAVGRRLADLKYTPDIDGLCQLIGFVNNVMTYFMRVEQSDGSWRYELEVSRSDDWGVWAHVTQLPSGIIALASQFPDQVIEVPMADMEN
jgi:hypothetical protein